MATGNRKTNTKRLFAAMAVSAMALCSAPQAADVQSAGFQSAAASGPITNSAAPQAPASHTKAMLEELREAEASRQLMPYLLALHVDGGTADGIVVRINVPIRFTDVPVELARGLFPRGDDETGRARLLQAYEELESIFSDELHKMSRRFQSSAFYQRTRGDICNVGHNDVCTALQAPLQAALQRAQAGKPYTLHIVHEWINFYGFFDRGSGELSSGDDAIISSSTDRL